MKRGIRSQNQYTENRLTTGMNLAPNLDTGHFRCDRDQQGMLTSSLYILCPEVRICPTLYKALKIDQCSFYSLVHGRKYSYAVSFIMILQADNEDFNKGVLLNTGYKIALERGNYTCFVFQDVDLIPEDDRIPYGCCRSPMHLSYAIDKYDYR
jgi:hypothetical protein